MVKHLADLYIRSYRGLPRNIWMLSLILLINRSGTMVIPFMTVYLTQELSFSITQAGLVLAVFGLGAVIGAYMGGKLSDRFGFYSIQFWSLLLNGIFFILLGQMHTLPGIMIVIFFMSVLGEAFRPANASAVAFYSTAENRTRSYSLNRLAVNLGWSVGPAIGGILASISYELLFWVDGLTCIGSALLFIYLFSKEKTKKPVIEIQGTDLKTPQSAYKDYPYLWFIVLVTLNAICFFQLFSIIPVYYKQEVHLPEFLIGVVLSINGLIIALTEMIVVYKLDGKRQDLVYIRYGVLIIGLSFIVLAFPWFPFVGVLFAMLLISAGEIISMPFMNSYWISRSNDTNRGQYAALYTIAYSTAHIVAPTLGAFMVAAFGFRIWWYMVAVICLITYWGFRRLHIKQLSL